MPQTINPQLLSWASDVDPETLRQAEKTARLPIVAGPVALVVASRMMICVPWAMPGVTLATRFAAGSIVRLPALVRSLVAPVTSTW